MLSEKLKGYRSMTLEDVENEIYEIYRWGSGVFPGITLSEKGKLGELWRRFDVLVRESAL